jgi:hypothetical protein
MIMYGRFECVGGQLFIWKHNENIDMSADDQYLHNIKHFPDFKVMLGGSFEHATFNNYKVQ